MTDVGDYETIVDISYSSNQHRRALITQDMSGLFRVRFEEWDTTGWESGESIYWVSASRASITDSLKHARKIARGQIGKLTGSS